MPADEMPPPDRSIPIDVHVNDDLEDAFRALVGAQRPSTTAPLREALWAYVDVAKRQGVPPERVVVGIKEVADRAGIIQSHGSHVSGVPFTTRDDALRDAVTWGIERYYSAEPA